MKHPAAFCAGMAAAMFGFFPGYLIACSAARTGSGTATASS